MDDAGSVALVQIYRIYCSKNHGMVAVGKLSLWVVVLFTQGILFGVALRFYPIQIQVLLSVPLARSCHVEKRRNFGKKGRRKVAWFEVNQGFALCYRKM